MKKILTLMILVVGLFSFSLGATFTFEEGKYQVYYENYSTDKSSYMADLGNQDNLEPNYISPALPDLTIEDDILARFPYVTFVYSSNSNSPYLFFVSDYPFVAMSSSSSHYLLNGANSIWTNSENITTYRQYYTTTTSGSWTFHNEFSTTNTSVQNLFGPIYFSNYDVLNRGNGTVVHYSDNYDESIKMENPLTSEEILAMVNNINSSDFTERPKNYNKYFLNYNTWTGVYDLYFYHDNFDLAGAFIKNDEDVDCYSLGLFYANYGFLDFINEKFQNASNRNFYLFTSLHGNPFFFNATVSFDYMVKKTFNVKEEPIVYTSHDIKWFTLVDDEVVEDPNLTIPSGSITDSSGNNVDVNVGDSSADYTWLDSLISRIKSIFVPSEDFLSQKANEIIYKFSFYTSLQDTYQQFVDAITVDSNGAPTVAVDFSLSEDSILADCGSANVLDLSWYEPFKPVVDLFIIAFVYGVFIYRFIIELPSTIAGISQGFEYIPLSKDSGYSGSGNFGFKTPGGGKK